MERETFVKAYTRIIYRNATRTQLKGLLPFHFSNSSSERKREIKILQISRNIYVNEGGIAEVEQINSSFNLYGNFSNTVFCVYFILTKLAICVDV